MARPGGDGRRTAVVVALLIATFALTAFIAMRGLAAGRYHQATAERVVSDWTRVALDELIRRIEAQAAFYGTYPLLQTLSAAPRLLRPAELAALATSDEMRRNARLVRATFRRDAAGVLEVSPGTPESVIVWLRETLRALAAAPPPESQRQPLHATFAEGARIFVYALSPAGTGIDGFEVDTSALPPFFDSALATAPLVPASLAGGSITNDAVRVRARDADGRDLYRSPAVPEGPLVVRQRPEKGLLRGATLDAAIAPELAPALVFGGLPRPARAIYLVPLLLAAGLLVTAVLQLRKERALARLRSEFVASVSHELRTPLTQIRMFAETLALDRVRTPDERRRSLAVIDQEARRLSQLVDNLLQFSRGERGTLVLARKPLDLAALARDTVAAFAPIAAARGVRVKTALAPAATVGADEDALRQVLLNLLDNAVKYGPTGQQVVVTVVRAGRAIRLTVDDQGPGIAARDRLRIWRRFERLQREPERAIAGAGIGLAVVHDLVALHGGRAWVEDADGGGARFVVELPEAGP